MASATEQTKKTTRQARTAAQSAAEAARVASEQGQRSVGRVVRNSAYATIGAGDLAVSVVRHLNQKAVELRTEAPNSVKSGVDPRQLSARIERRVEQVRSDATREFDRLSNRGRALVEGIQRGSSTRKTVEQIGNARSQVKAAATSVGRAARLAGQAAEDSVEKIGDETPVDYDSKSLEELKELARELEIPGRSSMNRDDLVEALERS